MERDDIRPSADRDGRSYLLGFDLWVSGGLSNHHSTADHKISSDIDDADEWDS